MYRNHLVKKDVQVPPLSTQRWGGMARPEEEQDGHLWPSEDGILLKFQFLFPLWDTVFSSERSGKSCMLELASLSRRSQNVEKRALN